MTERPRPTARRETFRFALRGIALMLRTEPNARFHALATLGVIAAGVATGIDRIEWLCLTLTIAAVWSLEAVNTALEALCDVASPEFHPQVERAKDVAAGAVLIAAVAAVVVALLVFGTRLLTMLST